MWKKSRKCYSILAWLPGKIVIDIKSLSSKLYEIVIDCLLKVAKVTTKQRPDAIWISPAICELWVAVQPVSKLQTVSPEAYSERTQSNISKSTILDVRMDSEYASGVNNQFVSWESYHSALYQVCIFSLNSFNSVLKQSESNKVIQYFPMPNNNS